MRRLFFLGVSVLLMLLVAACGGSPGTKVTVRVETAMGQPSLPLSVAYQVEDGDWEWLQPDKDASYGFYVPSGSERYGVAVRCGGLKGSMAPSYAKAALYQLTTGDTTEPVFVCPADEQEADASLSYDASGVTGAQSVMTFQQSHAWWMLGTSSSRDFSLPPQSSADLLFTAYSTNGYPRHSDLLAARLLRNIDVVEGATITLSLDDGGLVSWANVRPFSLPSASWSGSYKVGVISAGGVVAWAALGSGDEAGGTYARIANAAASDSYVLHAKANDNVTPSKELHLEYINFLSATSAGDLAVHFPDPLPESYEADGSSGHWRFSLDYPEDAIGLRVTVARFGEAKLDVWASTAWLQGLSSYTPPDLSPITGFGAFDSPAEGQWELCSIEGGTTFGELLSLPRQEYDPVPPGISKPLEMSFSCVGN